MIRIEASPELMLNGEVVLQPDSSTEIDFLKIQPDEQAFYLIEWDGDAGGRNHYYTNLLNIDYHKYLLALTQCGMAEFEN